MAEEDLLTGDGEQDSALDKKYADLIQKEREQVPLKRALYLAPKMAPGMAGDLIKLSNKTGLPRETVENSFDKVKANTDALLSDVDVDIIQKDAPRTYVWLQDKYNASATQNDRPLLQHLEKSLNNDPLSRPFTDEELTKQATEATNRRIKKMVAEGAKTMEFMAGTGSMRVQLPAIKDSPELRARLFQQEMASRRAENEFVSSPERQTAGEAFWKKFSENPMFMVPFGAAVPDIANAADLYQTVQRAKDGTADAEDMDKLIRYARMEAAVSRKGKTFGAHVAETAMGLPAFVGELMATGGSATAARTAVMGEAKSLAMRALGKTIEVGAQTALSQGLRIGANTFVYGTPQTTVTQDENGEMQLRIEDDRGAGLTVPLAKAVASSLIDVGAAHIPFHPAFKFWAKTAANPTAENFLAQMAKGGAESIVGGIGINDASKLAKELVGIAGPVEMPDTLKAMTGDAEALKRLGAQAVVFGPMGAIGSAKQQRRTQADLVQGEALSYKEMMHDATETVKAMEAQTKHPEVVADAVKGMVKDTPQEYTYVPATDFFDHYSKQGINPDQFAEELTGKPAALREALAHGTDLQIPTDQYLTKIGATDAGPVFEKAGARTKADAMTPDEAKDYIKQLDKEQEGEKKPKPTKDEAKLAEQAKALGDTLTQRSKEQGLDLGKFIEKNDVESATRTTARVAAAASSAEAARENFGQTRGLLEDVPNLAMNEKDAAAYATLRQEARDAAHKRLDAEALADLNRERKKQYAYQEADVRDRITKEVDQLPEYRAQSIMETGAEPDGTPVPEALGGIKFDRAAIEERYGEATLKAIPKELVTKGGGFHPDDLALVLGFSSGDELVQKMANLENKEAVIERRTNEVMRKMNLQELEELPQKAKEAVHSDEEAKVKAYQLKWLVENRLGHMKDLLRRVSSPKQYVEQLREYATDKVAKATDRERNPAMYEMAERRANKAARESLLSGDLEGAARYMDTEALNAELYRAAVAAKKETASIAKDMGRYNEDRVRAEIGKAGGNYLDRIDDIMDGLEFRKLSDTDKAGRESFRQWYEKQKALAADGLAVTPDVPDKLLENAYKKNYRDISLDDLRELHETAQQLEHLAKLKGELLAGREKRDFDAGVGAGVKSLEMNVPERPKTIEPRLPGVQQVFRSIRKFFASLRKIASMAREMDGFKDGGAMWDLLIRPINEAGNREATMKAAASKALGDIFKTYSPGELAKLYKREFVPEINASLSKMGQIMVALNSENEGNRQRLRDGYKWSDTQIDAIRNRLSEKDQQFKEGIFKFIDSYWPEIEALQKRVTGLAPEKVEGNYFPIKYEPIIDPSSAMTEAKADAKATLQGAALRATTKHGHREARMEHVERPLRLDFGVIFDHVNQVIHDLTHYEAVTDASRILADPRMSKAINERMGDIAYSQMKDWVRDIATGDRGPRDGIEAALNYIRQGASIGVLGWNLKQAVLDQTGLLQGAQRVGAGWVMRGLRKVGGDALHLENAIKEAESKSEMMANRGRTRFRELAEVRNSVMEKSRAAMIADRVLGAVTGDKVTWENFHQSFYWLMTQSQRFQDSVIWHAAYEKAWAEHKVESETAPRDREVMERRAIDMADQAVLDSFGGGQIKDLSAAQRNTALKIFFTFGSFANATLQRNVEALKQWKRTPGVVKSTWRLAGDLMLANVIPAAIGTVAGAVLSQRRPEDIPGDVLADQGAQLLGQIPIARELSPGIHGHDYEGPAGLRLLPAANKLVQGEADAKSVAQVVGGVFHFPATAVQRFFQGLVDMSNGRGTLLAPFFGVSKKR